MRKPTPPNWSAQVYEEACEWFVEFRLGNPDAARRAAFHSWLQQSPAHMGTYLEAAALWNQTAALKPGEKYSVEALIVAAATDRDNVRPLVPAPKPVAVPAARGGRRLRWSLVAGIALVAVSAVWAWVAFWSASQTYATAIGEERSIVLADGSLIELNSRSRVHVRYTARDREIQLVEGQALFTVAHDIVRPFLVDAGGTTVRAVGTQFDVNRLNTETVVTVLEGKVAVGRGFSRVLSAGGDAPPNEITRTEADTISTIGQGSGRPAAATLTVAAGEQLRVSHSGAVRRASRPDVAAATAWTRRRLVFEATPLADAVEEFNRYNARPLRITSAQLNDFQIDGVFSSTDPEPLIRFLRTRPGIRVTETEAAIEISPVSLQP